VLDEVDAALDATNVARVAHYIRNCTRESNRAGLDAEGRSGDGSKRQRRSGADGDSSGLDGPSEQRGGRGAGALESFQSIVISLKDIFYEKVSAAAAAAGGATSEANHVLSVLVLQSATYCSLLLLRARAFGTSMQPDGVPVDVEGALLVCNYNCAG
jgi:hypothetical protein